MPGHYEKFKQIEAALAEEKASKPDEKLLWEINEVKRHQETSVILSQRILEKLLASTNKKADEVETIAEIKQISDILRVLVEVEKSLSLNVESALKTGTVHSYLHKKNISSVT